MQYFGTKLDLYTAVNKGKFMLEEYNEQSVKRHVAVKKSPMIIVKGSYEADVLEFKKQTLIDETAYVQYG